MVIEKKDSKQQWLMQLCICHHYLLLTSDIITELDSVFDLSKNQEGNQFLINICSDMYLPLITPYATPMYDIPILPEAYRITPQWPTHK